MGRRWEAFKSWPLWHPNSWAFVKTYRIFKPFNRFLIIFSLIAGFLVLITCWYIDLGNSKWWHGHAYILNIWAGFTGFLIGAPVAAVILASFTVQREERSALTRVNELSRLAWEEFRTAVHKFASNDRLDALTNGVGDVQRIHDEIVRIIRGAKEQASSRKHDDPATDGEDRVDWLTRSTFTRAETTPQEFEKLKADLGQPPRRRQQERVAQRREEIFGEAARFVAGVELLVQRDERAGDVFVGDRSSTANAPVERAPAEQRADAARRRCAPCASAWSSSDSASRAEPPAGRAMSRAPRASASTPSRARMSARWPTSSSCERA